MQDKHSEGGVGTAPRQGVGRAGGMAGSTAGGMAAADGPGRPGQRCIARRPRRTALALTLTALSAWALVAMTLMARPAWAGEAPVPDLAAAGATEAWPVTLHRAQPQAQQRAEQALAQARTVAQRSQAWRQLAEVQVLYGQPAALRRLLDELPAQPGLQNDAEVQLLQRLYRATLATGEGQHVQAARLLAPLRQAGALPAEPALALQVQVALAMADDALGQRDIATARLVALAEQARRDGRHASEAQALWHLGEVQAGMRDYQRALDYYQQALALQPDWALQDVARLRMAVAQMTNIVGDRAQAFALLEPALAQFRRSQNISGMADALLLQGYFHDKAGRPAAALAAHRQALQLREQLGLTSDVINSLTHLTGVLGALGRHDEAVATGQRAVTMALRTDSPATQWDAHAGLAEALAAQGRHESAYAQMRLAERALLKLSRLDLIAQTGAIREKFETDRQALENGRLADKLSFERQEQQRLTLTIAAMLVLVSLLLLAVLTLVRLYWRTRHLARHDGLTGLLNRREVIAGCQDECERARRHGLPLSVLSFDLDNFKRINDQHGHAAGDQVLREVAQLCRRSLRRGDLAGRLGGEEFLLVLPHTDPAAALRLAERLRGQVQAEVQAAGGMPVTASLGVATLGEGQGADELLLAADQALYRAKHGGRNRAEVAATPAGGWPGGAAATA